MSGEFNVAAGYGSIDRARSRIEVYNNNLRGTALKLGVVGKVSFVQRGLEGSFTDPWTFGTKWRTDINMLTERKIEPDYAFDRTGGKLTLGRTIRKNTVTFAFRQEHVQLRDVKTTEIPVALTSNTRSLKLTFVRDLRNNLFNATEGMYIETSSEYGGYYTSRTSGFLRLLATFKYFYTISRDVVAATSFETGWIDSRQGFRSIPLQERFYIGGPNSLRGFKYTKAGDLDERGKAIGGSFKIQWNVVEFRRTLYRMVGGVIFADVGNVWQHAADVRFRDLRSDAGAGLRINTPIGLARLDYGFNLDRRPGEAQGHLYFSMGHAF
jgi:outer membrane protein insertion porin family